MRLAAIVASATLILPGCIMGSLRGGPELQPSQFAESNEVGESVAGMVGGGLIGGTLGAGLEAREKRTGLQAEYQALEATPAGEVVAWRSGTTGRSGRVVAGQPYSVGSQDCRTYKHKVRAGGGERTANGTACRNEDGSWTLLN